MNHKLKYILASHSAFMFAHYMLLPVFALFVAEIGGGIELAGILFGIQFFVTFVVALFVSRLKDQAAPELRMVQAFYLLRAIGWALVAVSPSIPTLIVSQIIMGASEGFGAPAWLALASKYQDTGKRLGEWADWEIMRTGTVGVASILGGFVAKLYGFETLLTIMAGLSVLAIFTLQAGFKKIKP